jgi:hypothetical protein
MPVIDCQPARETRAPGGVKNLLSIRPETTSAIYLPIYGKPQRQD